jgi:tRNA(fMet)-specific endonuclease VapC
VVVLDTDLISLLGRQDSKASIQLQKRLDTTPKREVFSSIISYEEQMRGWLSLVAKARSVSEEIRAYQRLLTHVEFFAKIPILPFDELAAVEFQRLKQLRVRIGTMDLKIAAIAISRKATLLSRNLRDFAQVSGLEVANWMA